MPVCTAGALGLALAFGIYNLGQQDDGRTAAVLRMPWHVLDIAAAIVRALAHCLQQKKALMMKRRTLLLGSNSWETSSTFLMDTCDMPAINQDAPAKVSTCLSRRLLHQPSPNCPCCNMLHFFSNGLVTSRSTSVIDPQQVSLQECCLSFTPTSQLMSQCIDNRPLRCTCIGD